MTFYMTFNSEHPLGKGWIEIEADFIPEARLKAFEVFGRHWAFIYPKDRFIKSSKFYPLGKLGETLKCE